MKDKVFVCQRCQKRIKKKTPQCEVEFEWTEDSFKEFKAEAKSLKEDFKLVLTSCLGSCPPKRVAYQKLKDNHIGAEECYPAGASRKDILKRLL